MVSNFTSLISEETDSFIISSQVKDIIQVLLYSIIGIIICLFGIFSNVANMIVFAKQGFQETVNVTLFALAVSDLASVITFLWIGICKNPLFKNSDIPFLSDGVHYLTGALPHTVFIRITGWLTALVTVERCLCVLFPLKVRFLITLGLVKGLVVAIYILVVASMAPNFYSTRLGWQFVPSRNRTMIGLVYTADKSEIYRFVIPLNSTIPSTTYFTLITLSTMILVVNLKRQAKWRQNMSAGKEHQTTAKEKKVVKMVVFLAVLFIACLLPHKLATIPVSFDPEFSLSGKHRNVFIVVGAIVLTLEAVNSSLNIFIYYNMSSRYRSIFRSIFHGASKQ